MKFFSLSMHCNCPSINLPSEMRTRTGAFRYCSIACAADMASSGASFGEEKWLPAGAQKDLEQGKGTARTSSAFSLFVL